MCLLDIIADKSAEFGFDFVVVNVEHGIRGEISKRDSEFVRSYAISCGYEIMSFSVDCLDYAEQNGLSVETAARELRYRCFSDLINSGAVDKIATAHHAADQTETILLRLARGTGVAGLGGIPEERGGIIRPLLSVSREYIDEYVAVNNIPYVTDETNFDDDYNRNYFRLRVIPVIKARYPELDRSITRLTRDAFAVDKYLTKTALKFIFAGDPYFGLSPISEHINALSSAFPNYYSQKINTRPMFFDTVSLSTSIEKEDEVIIKKAIAATFKLMGIFKDIEYRHLSIACDSLGKANGYSVNMPFGVTLFKEYSHLVFSRELNTESYAFKPEKDVVFLSGGRKFTICPAGPDDRIRFDFAAIPANAVVRTRLEGDKFTAFSGHTKSLGDWFTDNKIPSRVRDVLPMIAAGDRILAISGCEISPDLKITASTDPVDVYTIKTTRSDE